MSHSSDHEGHEDLQSFSKNPYQTYLRKLSNLLSRSSSESPRLQPSFGRKDGFFRSHTRDGTHLGLTAAELRATFSRFSY